MSVFHKMSVQADKTNSAAEAKLINLHFIGKLHMHLCYHSEILWASEKFYSIVIKWNVAQSLNICYT